MPGNARATGEVRHGGEAANKGWIIKHVTTTQPDLNSTGELWKVVQITCLSYPPRGEEAGMLIYCLPSVIG